MKKSKSQAVKNHLIKKGQLTSWEAIEKYKVTRLAAIVFNLKKSGMSIQSVSIRKKDKDGQMINFVKYVHKAH